jgi:membrane protein implicated in regulation of membrane protease activity
MAKVAAFLLTHLELVLAGMSIPVIGLVHFFISEHFADPWKITAAAAVAVGVLHGAIGWFVRGRQRSSRLELLQRLWAILQKDGSSDGSETAAQTLAGRLTETDIRVAKAQLVALVREPLVVKTIAPAARIDLHVPSGFTT